MKNIRKMAALVLLLMAFASQGVLGEAAESPQDSGPSNILIVSFSRVGVTDFEEDVDAVTSASLNLDDQGVLLGNGTIAAQYIQEATGGEMFQILTEQRYPSGYRETTDLAAEEKSATVRPALTTQVENMEAYDTIILVYPNWWAMLPMPVYTFLESYDFIGKTILPLCTHEGSGLSATVREIEETCPGATVLAGLAIRGGSMQGAQRDIQDWLQNSGIL